MFGIVTCSQCQRDRIIDLSDGVTVCPYCGGKAETKKLAIRYKNESQDEVRKVLDSASGVVLEKKTIREDIDPLSTLAYKVEHTVDLGEKMDLIADGLTSILGSFTVKDVDDLVPGKGKQFVAAMLDACMIYETEANHYRA